MDLRRKSVQFGPLRPFSGIEATSETRLHHLFRNRNTYWIHYTLVSSDSTVRRIRESLGTRDVEEAIRRRDRRLHEVSSAPPRHGDVIVFRILGTRSPESRAGLRSTDRDEAPTNRSCSSRRKATDRPSEKGLH